MKKRIERESEYDEQSFYIDRGMNGNIQVCMQKHWDAICIHLTSTNPEYQDWLYKHAASLLMIPKENWFYSRQHSIQVFYDEFHQVLKRLREQA